MKREGPRSLPSGVVAHPVDPIEQHPRAAHALLGLDSPQPNLPVVLFRGILVYKLLNREVEGKRAKERLRLAAGSEKFAANTIIFHLCDRVLI